MEEDDEDRPDGDDAAFVSSAIWLLRTMIEIAIGTDGANLNGGH